MDGMRISDASAATGFAPSALRYYERIGLLPRPRRDASGYRVYDHDALDRLRFVGRAKGLGLSLEEIAELLQHWNGGACATTRERLRRLVADKLDEVWRRIDALRALGAQLEDAHGHLARPATQARCGTACGCPPEIEDRGA